MRSLLHWPDLYEIEGVKFRKDAEVFYKTEREHYRDVPGTYTSSARRLGRVIIINGAQILEIQHMLWLLVDTHEPYRLAMFLDQLLSATDMDDALKCVYEIFCLPAQTSRLPGIKGQQVSVDSEKVLKKALVTFYQRAQHALMHTADELLQQGHARFDMAISVDRRFFPEYVVEERPLPAKRKRK